MYHLLKSCLQQLHLDKTITQLLHLVFMLTPAVNLVTDEFLCQRDEFNSQSNKFKSQSDEFNSQPDEFICQQDGFICQWDEFKCKNDEFNWIQLPKPVSNSSGHHVGLSITIHNVNKKHIVMSSHKLNHRHNLIMLEWQSSEPGKKDALVSYTKMWPSQRKPA